MTKLRFKRYAIVAIGSMWRALKDNPLMPLGMLAMLGAVLSVVKGLRTELPFDERSYFLLQGIVGYYAGRIIMNLGGSDEESL